MVKYAHFAVVFTETQPLCVPFLCRLNGPWCQFSTGRFRRIARYSLPICSISTAVNAFKMKKIKTQTLQGSTTSFLSSRDHQNNGPMFCIKCVAEWSTFVANHRASRLHQSGTSSNDKRPFLTHLMQRAPCCFVVLVLWTHQGLANRPYRRLVRQISP